MPDIYFDNASTTRPCQESLDVFARISKEYYGNASSAHQLGSESLNVMEKARRQILSYFSHSDSELIFTSGATEGNNLAIKGVAIRERGWANRIITTKAEHPSVLRVFQELEKEGFDVVYLSYDKEGRIDLAQLKSSVDSHTSLVSVMACNNEVGYLFDIAEIRRIISSTRARLHVDATQYVGKEDLKKLDYDLLTFSGHKISGLKGIGALVKRKNVLLSPQILGGGQEEGYRSGTSPVPLACSLAAAMRVSIHSLPERRRKAEELNTYLRNRLSEIEEVEILSPLSSTPFILSFALHRHKGSVVAEELSRRHIYVSTKSACSSREEGYSYVVLDAGYDRRTAENVIRLSFSGEEKIEEGERFILELSDILHTIREEKDGK